jgi:UDP-N-acetylglucosamine--N-acetylmuramyl-(pentapeptide) pyrophosphoryl-undecaprenol N-acetylglucosamine transferase
MKNKKHIIFTGGGTAGHVTPNIALIQKFRDEGVKKEASANGVSWDVSYIGSHHGIERELIGKIDVPYFSIATGKLRRYFSWQNFLDPFKIVCGIWQAFWLCRKLQPDIIFSKGGFVSFPVVVGGWLNNVPIVLHESDLIPGLANKLSYPFAKKICLSFADSARYFSDKGKLSTTGTPIRANLLNGSKERGLKFCGFTADKKVMLVFGGSLGAGRINKIVRAALPQLINENLQIVHICGAGKVDNSCNYAEYKQFEYLDEEFPHVLAAADLVISRAGANSVYELLALRKPHIFVPLTASSSRGDQIANAQHFEKQGLSQVILEEQLSVETLMPKVRWVLQNQRLIISKLKTFEAPNSIEVIYQMINNLLLPEI